MAEFMFPNVAYRETVYRTGDLAIENVRRTQQAVVLFKTHVWR